MLNLIKRIKNITGKLLLLETHIAPPCLEGLSLRHIYRFSFEKQVCELDGIPFEGKIVEHIGDPSRTKGSLDSPWTFWLRVESLLEALLISGFEILHFYYKKNDSWPDVMKKYGTILNLGHENTKVLIVARPADADVIEAQEPIAKIIEGKINWSDTFNEKLKRRKIIHGQGFLRRKINEVRRISPL